MKNIKHFIEKNVKIHSNFHTKKSRGSMEEKKKSKKKIHVGWLVAIYQLYIFICRILQDSFDMLMILGIRD